MRRRTSECIQVNPPRNAIEALDRLESQFGEIVVGFPATETMEVMPGDELGQYMGSKLAGCRLIIVRPATFDDWQKQADYLKVRNPHKPAPGQAFLCCALDSLKR